MRSLRNCRKIFAGCISALKVIGLMNLYGVMKRKMRLLVYKLVLHGYWRVSDHHGMVCRNKMSLFSGGDNHFCHQPFTVVDGGDII